MSAFLLHRSVAVGSVMLPAVFLAIGGPVRAADLSVVPSAPPMLRGALPEEAPFDWSGASLGIEAGYVRGDKQTLRLVGANAQEQGLIDAGGLGRVAVANSGFAAGAGLGYDRQLAPGSGPVLGAVVDLRYTDLDRTRHASVGLGGNSYALTAQQRLDMLGTVRGRLGYAFDRVLVYGTAGLAFGRTELSGRTDITTPLGSGPLDAGTHRGWEAGLVYGGGIAVAAPRIPMPGFLDPDALSFKVEYLRYDLGTRNVPIHGTGPVFGPGGTQPLGHTATARFRSDGQLVSAGIAYRFGGL